MSEAAEGEKDEEGIARRCGGNVWVEIEVGVATRV